jgi:hypothetical protein
MPRAGWVKPETEQRLSDHISIGVLTRTYPPDLVDRVVAAAGKRELRHRLLPARVVVYYVMAMALYAEASYEEVMRFLVEGLSWMTHWRQGWQVPTKAAIFKSRSRLGVEPVRELFKAVARPLAAPGTAGAWYRGWRLMAIDGTSLDVADTVENSHAFGRSGVSRGERAAFPKIRLVGLAECGTHAIVAAALGHYRTHEQTLAQQVIGSLGPNMLCLADRGLLTHRLWMLAKVQGADLLWRARLDMRLIPQRVLADGSWIAPIYDSSDVHRERPEYVRAIEYVLQEPDQQSPDHYRLLTTILDPERAPAEELAALYPQRWEFETAIDELKTHQRGPRIVLRSKQPDGVYQEAYGYLLTHYAIRALMHDAALQAGLDPDRLSFLRSLRVVRPSTLASSGLFFPSGPSPGAR